MPSLWFTTFSILWFLAERSWTVDLYSTYVFNFVFLVFELFSISRLWVDPIASIFRYEILKVKKYSLWIFGVKRSLKHKDRDADRFWCCGKSDPNSTINLSSGGSHAVPRVAPWGSSFSSSYWNVVSLFYLWKNSQKYTAPPNTMICVLYTCICYGILCQM